MEVTTTSIKIKMNQYQIKPEATPKRFAVRDCDGNMIGVLTVSKDGVQFVGRGKLELAKENKPGENKVF